MKHLVFCTCAHSLEKHEDAGCSGDAVMSGCACRLTQSQALDAAVAAASTQWAFGESRTDAPMR